MVGKTEIIPKPAAAGSGNWSTASRKFYCYLLFFSLIAFPYRFNSLFCYFLVKIANKKDFVKKKTFCCFNFGNLEIGQKLDRKAEIEERIDGKSEMLPPLRPPYSSFMLINSQKCYSCEELARSCSVFLSSFDYVFVRRAGG